ncbi:MAG: hypothetical protein AVDCRST_MAG29-1726 [uncultured Nocardioidaceae bacterium]|uniref:Uncharacterized protein n=1 Tax=uncultured Nocardioidaceae bacterium TaxID=253824 RepID=A0A6J4LW08_9ACTN|nr:MAG: hypothetical protein AVDCRST_MAG29-1726 [uncultured Nocardioidaceae bacterium]
MRSTILFRSSRPESGVPTAGQRRLPSPAVLRVPGLPQGGH